MYRSVQRASSILIIAVFASTAEASGLLGGQVVVLGLAATIVLALLLYEAIYYHRFEYELTEDTLNIRSGVISRREREIPYHRIQNVDVKRNVIQRLLGIAEVSFETAGGSHTEGSFRYVWSTEADRLQRILRDQRPADEEAVISDQGQTEAEDGDETLFAISPRELGLVGALSFDARVVGLLTLVGPGSIPIFSEVLSLPMALVVPLGGALILGLLVASWLLGIVIAVINFYGFRLTRSDDQLHYERGLYRRFSGSIPLEKIQSIAIKDNPAMRAFGYGSLIVETAGYAPGRNASDSTQVAIPIARKDRIYSLAQEIEDVKIGELSRPPSRIRRRYVVRYIIVFVGLIGLVAALDRVLTQTIPWYWLLITLPVIIPAAHLKYVHRGYALGPDHVITRNGFWNRSVTVVPYYRIQTVIDTRTLFQRRWNVATINIDTAVANSIFGTGVAAVDIDNSNAESLRESLADRLQIALLHRQSTISTIS